MGYAGNGVLGFMEQKINFSVVVTVLNEAKSILPLLDSLVHQTLPPKEILVADAGSTDLTVKRIVEWKKQYPDLHLSIIECRGCNRSRGRNLAIEKAANNNIAVTDAGCIADKDWLEHLAEGFAKEEDVEVVAGYYMPVTETTWQKLFAIYTTVIPERLDEAIFLPSSRSIAFTKQAWRAVGMYPEYLDTCEDLVFAAKLKDEREMVVNRQALVYWHLPRTPSGFVAQIAGYARGDLQAKYMPHVKKIMLVYARYLLMLLLFPLFLVYWLYPIWRHHQYVRTAQEMVLLPVVQVLSDIGVMWGGLQALKLTIATALAKE